MKHHQSSVSHMSQLTRLSAALLTVAPVSISSVDLHSRYGYLDVHAYDSAADFEIFAVCMQFASSFPRLQVSCQWGAARGGLLAGFRAAPHLPPVVITGVTATLRDLVHNYLSKYITDSHIDVLNYDFSKMIDVDQDFCVKSGSVKELSAKRKQDSDAGVVVDYLRMTFAVHDYVRHFNLDFLSSELHNDDLFARIVARRLARLLNLGDCIKHGAGRDFYDVTYKILLNDGEVASVSAGGKNQRGTCLVELKGAACTYAVDDFAKILHDTYAPVNPTITRIDLAYDDFAGVSNPSVTCAAYFAGGFDNRAVRPKYTQIGQWEKTDKLGRTQDMCSVLNIDFNFFPNSQNNRTFYVGTRSSGKIFRSYEKGHQLGDLSDSWTRHELELRSVNRIIPFDALLHPADYFAGGYKFCQFLLEKDGMKHQNKIVKTSTSKIALLTVKRSLRWLERSVGKMIASLAIIMPDFSWVEDLAVKHAARGLPNSFDKVRLDVLQSSVEDYFNVVAQGAKYV